MVSPRETDSTKMMPKHSLNWKPVKAKSLRGTDIYVSVPDVLDLIYRGTLLSSILAMEKKTPILFGDAVRMAIKKKCEVWYDENADSDYYYDNFIEWISSQGYHIELTGDEFEPALMS